MHFEFPSALQPQNLKGFIGGIMEVHCITQMSGECGSQRGWWWVVVSGGLVEEFLKTTRQRFLPLFKVEECPSLSR